MNNLVRTVSLALKSLMLHKLRSGLTMLGIVFGVCSVIAMLAIGEGASRKAQDQVLQLGATNIIVRSVKPPKETASSNTSQGFVLRYGLQRSDFDLLDRTIPTVSDAIPMRELLKTCRHRHREMNARIVGCSAEYYDINHLTVARGRFISDKDRETKANVAVLAAETAAELFQYEDPIGQSVKIGDRFYAIVGVTMPREASAAIGGSMSGQDYNNDIYIPLETMQVRLGDLNIDRTPGSFSAEYWELSQITLRVRDQEDVVKTADSIRDSLKRSHGDDLKDVSVVVPLELLRQAKQIRVIFNVVLGSIAAISLVVGGIGIMNIMLATVTERTREIGVRRALGAKQADITKQFLTETIVLAGSGGLIGIIVALLIVGPGFSAIKGLLTYFLPAAGPGGGSELAKMTEIVPQVVPFSLPLAFGISVVIGVLSGLYPARSAARLDPIEALRHE